MFSYSRQITKRGNDASASLRVESAAFSPFYARTLHALDWLGRGAIFFFCVYFILAYLYVALHRMAYPFELEWIEGNMWMQVQRVIHHQALYVPPALANIPSDYNPLYYYAGALATKLLGGVFLPLRFVSFIASLAAFAMLGWFVWRETGKIAAAGLAVCLFAAMFSVSYGFFDLARNDSLSLFFFVLEVVLLRHATRLGTLLIAAVVLFLAFLVRQTTVVFFLPLLVHVLCIHRVRGALMIAVAFLLIAGSMLWLNLASHGWYWFYIFTLPQAYERDPDRWHDFWHSDIAGSLSMIVAFALFFMLSRFSPKARCAFSFYGLLLAGVLVTTSHVRTIVGAEINNNMPLYAVFVLLATLGYVEAVEQTRRAPWVIAIRVRVLIRSAIAIQFSVLLYTPSAYLPTVDDRQAGENLLQYIRSVKGDVLVPSHPFLLAMAGKPTHFHLQTLVDLYRTFPQSSITTALDVELKDRIERQQYGAVILDSWFGLPDIRAKLDKHYEWKQPVLDWNAYAAPWRESGLSSVMIRLRFDQLCMPTAGLQTRPADIFVPIPHIVQLIEPAGTVVWRHGDTVPVHWKTQTKRAGTAVRIELRRADTIRPLVTDWNPEGEHTVPITIPDVQPAVDYRLRIVSNWDSAYWTETGPVRIE